MGSIADELVTIPFFSRAPSREVRASAPLWELLTLSPGEPLWDEGSAVDALAIVLIGELEAELGGTTVGRIMPGELLGEASAFFAGTKRSATLRARTPAQVLSLPIASLHTLRWQRSPVYDALLDQALHTLVRRVASTNTRIAQVATGDTKAPARTEPSALVRLWKALRPGGPSGPCPDLEPLLRRQPGLADVDGELIAALSRAFVAEPVEEGQVVFLEGEAGAAAWLVADGEIDVLRNVRGDRAELLATLKPGSSFGFNTLIERGARTASCVAARAGWLYRVDAAGQSCIRGPNRLVWRESLLASFATQIRNANTALQKVSGPVRAGGAPRSRDPLRPNVPHSAGDDGFQALLQASGWLEGVPDVDLEAMEVVRTEHDRRNPRRKYT